MYDNNNVFAKIIRGEIPCKKIYENEFAVSFYDANPVAKTHVLIIPKGGYVNMFDFLAHASATEQADFWTAVHETAKIMGCDKNCNILTNVGEGTFFYQSVPHFHVHIIAGEKLKDFADITK